MKIQKSLIAPILVVLVASLALKCSSTKVLDKTSKTAIIQAEGKSKTEAKLKGIQKAREILGESIEETQEAECTPLISYGGYEISGTQLKGDVEATPFTDYRCIVHVKKK